MVYEWVQHSLSVGISTAALNKVKLTKIFVQNEHFLNELASYVFMYVSMFIFIFGNNLWTPEKLLLWDNSDFPMYSFQCMSAGRSLWPHHSSDEQLLVKDPKHLWIEISSTNLTFYCCRSQLNVWSVVHFIVVCRWINFRVYSDYKSDEGCSSYLWASDPRLSEHACLTQTFHALWFHCGPLIGTVPKTVYQLP